MSGEQWRYVLTVDGRDFEFGEGEVTLGRSRTATVRVEHESVSRSHALLTFESGNALLKDLNSSNGTYVAGRRILNEARLSEKETIQLGAAVVGFRVITPGQLSERTAHIDAGFGTLQASRAVPVVAQPESRVATEEVAPPQQNEAAAPAAGDADVPFEISAGELLGKGEGRERAEQAHDARAALEAVRKIPDSPFPFAMPPPPPAPPPPSVSQRSAQLASRSLSLSPSPGPVQSVAEFAFAATGAGASSMEGVPAAFGQRLLASMVDAVIVSAINFLLLTPVILIVVFLGGGQGSSGPRWEIVAIGALSVALILAADLWYTVGGLARSGRTPGKALLRIAVVGPPGTAGPGLGYRTAFVRVLFQAIGSIPFCLGSLVVLFRKDRRAWHDLVAGTWVVKAP